jgi:hypothetical protein
MVTPQHYQRHDCQQHQQQQGKMQQHSQGGAYRSKVDHPSAPLQHKPSLLRLLMQQLMKTRMTT